MFSMQTENPDNSSAGQEGSRPASNNYSGRTGLLPKEFQIYVGNLNWKVSNEDLKNFFGEFGDVKFAKVVMDRENPFRSRGFGFVGFANAEQAQNAVEKCDQEEFMGRKIMVNMAKPRVQRDDQEE
ncbi:hypothetical protein GUITHDRAFT_117814 [Guillardia theta CCMP2712]|uniref:RRM domain-containing protein n=1 Tax=Guillardia theta (strain CCMP2712) TaxID=905079 RepID=L1IJN6_GUITC|nr:hypothetical protein GUITHDRAFT_117814 [Guillardia theta CCMP2712]EKX36025.1 hypothetical protein GUITHDRAFT_117814 [Guillardia theta CCMP2712]|eukprot:XP_005823005.1 hypothetical protein GUITHDRAFT_117814 [Guillardia theta CCMP2712]